MFYFISDTHFFHERIRTSCNRPFASVDEMNHTIIQNWQRTVTPKDTVFFLGDFTWDASEGIGIWNNLNGKKVFIKGNHDGHFISAFSEKQEIKTYDVFELHHNKTIITMCHYPMISWNKSHYNSPMLYGHVHNEEIPLKGKMLNVSVEKINYTPISLDEVMARIEKLPDNWNLVKERK